ncbi:MAG: hypothetical protein Q4B05_03045, partial [Candidatus Saccharibacteria bacterium]|nr:hypothetical protein [Candidatus Saccharibacteria bacterium]
EDAPDDTPEPVRGDSPDDGMDDDNPKQNPNKSEGVLQPGKGAEADNFENHANGTGPAARPPASEKDEHGGPEPPKKSGSSAREHTQEQKDLIAKLKIARGEFIEAKVAVESSFFKKWVDGIRRHERLDAARAAVAALEVEVAKFQLRSEIDRIREEMAGNRKGAAEEQQAINSLMTMYVFKQIKDVENGAARRYDQMLEERSGFKKAMAKVGSFFMTGGKFTEWLKPLGVGFGVGVSTGFVAAWPITAVVGIGSSTLVGAVSKQAALQERAGEERIGDDEAQVSGWLEMLNAGVGAEDVDARLREIAERAYGASTEDSRLRQDELRKKVRGTMGKYAAGFAIGSIVGAQSSQLVQGSTSGVTGGEGGAPTGSEGSPTSNPTSGVTGGEGGAPTGSEGGGTTGGEDIARFVEINTNIHGPEHALQDLLKLSPGQADALMAELQNTSFNMDNLFVDSFGNPVDITNYGGKIGHGFTTWNNNLSLELTVEAKKALEALGYIL